MRNQVAAAARAGIRAETINSANLDDWSGIEARIDADEVVETLRARPGYQHVVITGRRPDPRLLELADLATEMTKVKHPMDVGRKGQRGLEW